MKPATPFSGFDYCCALAAVVIWGTNFVVMKIGLQTLSPMFLGAMRYIFATVLFLPFVRRTTVPPVWVIASGLLAFGQFGLLFIGMRVGMPAGMASLLMQTQAFFTVILAALLLGEHPKPYQWLGVAVSAAGLAAIAAGLDGGAGGITLAGLVLTLTGALMWAAANLVARFAMRASPGYDPLAFIIYSSLAPILPFAVLSWWMDGGPAIGRMLHELGWREIMAAAYLGIFGTVIAYSMWTRLLTRHAAGRVAPFSLLVPVVGLYLAAALFSETMTLMQWLGAGLVLCGLLLNQFGGRLGALLARR